MPSQVVRSCVPAYMEVMTLPLWLRPYGFAIAGDNYSCRVLYISSVIISLTTFMTNDFHKTNKYFI